MYTNLSNEYITNRYTVAHTLKIYFDGVQKDVKILGFNPSFKLFSNDEFTLGSVIAQMIELKLYKSEVPSQINRVYIESETKYGNVPIGYFNVEDPTEEDDYTITLKLIDDMVKFEDKYDGSDLTYPCTIKSVLDDICLKIGVECGSASFLNMNKQVAVYDNSISARTYLSYIAEQAGGFACIGRNGKLYIKSIGQDIVELPLTYFENYKWGEKFKFTRVRYEDGIQLYEAGDTTGNTIYINQENMYIVDQDQIDNIYNLLSGLEVYSFEGASRIDPAIDVGDLLLIDGKYVVYQGSSEYARRFKTNISSKIQCKAKEETMSKSTSQKVINRRVQSQIDQAEGKITQLVLTQDEQGETLNSVENTITDQGETIKVISTNIDEDGNVTGVKTTNGFTFNSEGMKVNVEGESINTTVNHQGVYTKDNDEVVMQADKDGLMGKDFKQRGQHKYAHDGTDYLFADELIEVDGEYGYATFYNGND